MRKWSFLSKAALSLLIANWLCFLHAEEPKEEPAAAPPKAAVSRITQVTVYQNNALVTREVDVPEGKGAVELVVTPLPPQTVNSSLYSEGTDGIRVLSTRFRTRPIKEDTREEVRKAEAKMKGCQETAQKLAADIKSVEMNMQMLSKLEGFTAVTATSSTEKAQLNSETVIALAKYVMGTRDDKTKDVVALQQQLQNNAEQAEFIQRQLQELAAGRNKTERDAVIVVDKQNAAAGNVRLNYLVDAASWRPQYKFRAGKTEKDPVQVEYLAAVKQQTGEEWNNVQLILSTAQPMLNAAPPDLQILEVGATSRSGPAIRPAFAGDTDSLDRQSKALRQQAQEDYNRRKEQSGEVRINEAAALEQTNDLLNVKDELFSQKKGPPPIRRMNREGQSVTYHLSTKLTVPSRNDEQILEVGRIDMTPDYFYKAVPVLTGHIYRLANLTNKSKYVLLPGEATMYQGSDFVGRMDLPLVAIGEDFTAGFGVDPQLQVQRQMTDKSRSTQGGNQVLKYEYRILVSSYKPEVVKLQVWDRLPYAETEIVGVSLVKTAPELSTDSLFLREDRPHNLLRWDVKIEPTMSGDKALALTYEFKLELDRQLALGSSEGPVQTGVGYGGGGYGGGGSQIPASAPVMGQMVAPAPVMGSMVAPAPVMVQPVAPAPVMVQPAQSMGLSTAPPPPPIQSSDKSMAAPQPPPPIQFIPKPK